MAKELILYRINTKEKRQVPFYDESLWCGSPHEVLGNAEMLNLAEWVGDGAEEIFLAVLQGDSMIDLGYMPGDFCIVNREKQAHDGDVIVAYIDKEYTMKVLHIDEENKKVVLYPANQKYKPIEIDNNTQEFRAWGVVTRCIKNTRNGLSIIKARLRTQADEKRTLSAEKIRKCVLTLFEEGLMADGKGWFAIYKVLNKYEGYPVNMKEFCDCIDGMGLQDVKYPCVYNNWRKMTVELKLPINVDLWPEYKDKVSGQALRQINIMERLKDLLDIS